MSGLGFLTFQWGLADLGIMVGLGSSTLGAAITVLLVTCAVGSVIFGFGALIHESYWEHRVYRIVFVAWILCCFIGVVVILLSLLSNPDIFGIAGILNLIGLCLTIVILTVPAYVNVSSGSAASSFSHIWAVLLVIAAMLLTGGMLLNFPYNFTRFPLGVTGAFLLGLGVLEIYFAKPGMIWLPQLWKTQSGNREFLALLPTSSFWKTHGIVMLFVGIFVLSILLGKSLNLMN